MTKLQNTRRRAVEKALNGLNKRKEGKKEERKKGRKKGKKEWRKEGRKEWRKKVDGRTTMAAVSQYLREHFIATKHGRVQLHLITRRG